MKKTVRVQGFLMGCGTAFGVAALLTVAPGCGRPKGSRTQVGGQSEAGSGVGQGLRQPVPAEALGLGLILAAPSQETDAGGKIRVLEKKAAHFLAQNKVLTLVDPVQVPERNAENPGQLYLSIPAKTPERAIVSASYDHKKVFPNLRPEDGSSGPRVLAYDSKEGVFLLPVLDLVGGKAYNADPAVHHWISFHLVLEGGTIARINLNLRLFGPIPTIERKAAVMALTQGSYSSRAFVGGAVLFAEEFTNPSDRNLKLGMWGDFKFQMHSGIRIFLHKKEFGEAPKGYEEHRRSSAFLRWTGVQVASSEDGFKAVRTVNVTSSSRRFTLFFKANSRLRVGYVFEVAPGTSQCAEPHPFNVEVPWTSDVRPGVRFAHLMSGGMLAGFSVTGQGQAQFEVSDNYLPDSAGLERVDTDASRVHAFEANWALGVNGAPIHQVGQVDFRGPAFDCQGSF